MGAADNGSDAQAWEDPLHALGWSAQCRAASLYDHLAWMTLVQRRAKCHPCCPHHPQASGWRPLLCLPFHISNCSASSSRLAMHDASLKRSNLSASGSVYLLFPWRYLLYVFSLMIINEAHQNAKNSAFRIASLQLCCAFMSTFILCPVQIVLCIYSSGHLRLSGPHILLSWLLVYVLYFLIQHHGAAWDCGSQTWD